MSARREFSRKVRAQAHLRANGRCEACSARLKLGEGEYDHILPDELGGEPTLENCKLICVVWPQGQDRRRHSPHPQGRSPARPTHGCDEAFIPSASRLARLRRPQAHGWISREVVMSNPMTNECVVAAVQEIESAGFKPTVEPRGKHLAVVWRQGQDEKQYFAPATPSDRRAWLNCRADVRRMLREAVSSGSSVVPISAPRLMTTDDGVVASSRDIADAFEKRHAHVLRDIDNLLKNLDCPDLGNAMFRPISETDGSGISRRAFHVDRDGFALLAMGFSGPKALRFKLAYVQAFNAMERAIARDRDHEALTAREDMRRLQSDLSALTDLVLEAGSPSAPSRRRSPFIRPSILRRQRREARA